MQAVFDGLEASGASAEISKIPKGTNIVGSKCILKCKGDEHCMIDRAKAISLAKGYGAGTCDPNFT